MAVDNTSALLVNVTAFQPSLVPSTNPNHRVCDSHMVASLSTGEPLIAWTQPSLGAWYASFVCLCTCSMNHTVTLFV